MILIVHAKHAFTLHTHTHTRARKHNLDEPSRAHSERGNMAGGGIPSTGGRSTAFAVTLPNKNSWPTNPRWRNLVLHGVVFRYTTVESHVFGCVSDLQLPLVAMKGSPARQDQDPAVPGMTEPSKP